MKTKNHFGALALIAVFLFVLAGCASTNLTAPCPNFGKHCSKTPINSWNYKTA